MERISGADEDGGLDAGGGCGGNAGADAQGPA